MYYEALRFILGSYDLFFSVSKLFFTKLKSFSKLLLLNTPSMSCCPLISFCCGETARAYALPDSAQKPGMIREAKGRIRANVSLSLSVVSQLKDDG